MLTAGCVMIRRSAAALNDSQSTTAQNTSRCRRFTGGLRSAWQRDKPGTGGHHSRLSPRDRLRIRLRLLGLLPRPNLHPCHPQPVHVLHGEGPAVESDGVPDLRTPTQVSKDESTKRVVFGLAERDSELVLHVGQQREAVDQGGPVRASLHEWGRGL